VLSLFNAEPSLFLRRAVIFYAVLSLFNAVQSFFNTEPSFFTPRYRSQRRGQYLGVRLFSEKPQLKKSWIFKVVVVKLRQTIVVVTVF
jgi:hypothetical protein